MEIPLEVPDGQIQFGESPKREEASEVVKQSPPRSPSKSPEPQCSICLGNLRNKSFTDSCFHQFCFDCLQKWSKVRPVCPLCKHQFKSIIHNVRSDNDFDQYDIPAPEPDPWPDLQQLGHRFSYRTNLTPERMRALAIQRILLHSRLDNILPRSLFTSPDLPHRRGSSDFRLRVYMDNLWVQISPDITGRYRECSPEFYRENPSTMHRLVPWLNRELAVLLENMEHSITYIIELIMELLTRFNIQSTEMENELRNYLRDNTVHFLHEFYNFARSPYDLQGYDLHATYTVRPRGLVIPQRSSNEVVLSDNEVDVILIESSPEMLGPPSPVAGPSNRFNLQSSPTTPGSTPAFNVKEEDSDSDSCEVLAVLKPKHERTPVIVTLSESDNDDRPRNTSATAENGWSTDSEIFLSDSPSTSVCGSSNNKRKKKSSSDSEWEQPSRKKKKKSKKSSRKSSKSKRKSKHRHWKKSLRKSFVETVSSPSLSSDSDQHAAATPQPSTSKGKEVRKYKPRIDRSKFRKNTDSREVSSPPATRTSARIHNHHLPEGIGAGTSRAGDIQRARLERRCKTYASAALEHSPVLDLVLSDEEANDSSDSETGSFGWRSQPVRDCGLKLVISNNKGNARREAKNDSSKEEEEKSPPRRVKYKRPRCSSKKYISSSDDDSD